MQERIGEKSKKHENFETNWQAALELLRGEGVTADPETLKGMFDGFFEGQQWALQRFNFQNEPDIGVAYIAGSGVVAAYVPGKDIIMINYENLKHFKNVSTSSGFNMPIRQSYEASGVHETIHFLQDKKVKGLVSLPATFIEPNTLENARKMFMQPHEREAYRYSGLYLSEKYGFDPFKRFGF